MTVMPIDAIGAAVATESALRTPVMATAGANPTSSFAQILLSGVDRVNQTMAAADAKVAAFALDDSIPLHQVMFALEEARISFEFMLQVRSRLVEGYQKIMDMQL